MMDFLSNLNFLGQLGSGGDLNWVGGVLTLIIGGAFIPAGVTVAVNLLRLPGLRQAVTASCFVAGKAVSALATRRLGSVGQKLEDGLQEIKNIANDAFDRGLDADDLKSGS